MEAAVLQPARRQPLRGRCLTRPAERTRGAETDTSSRITSDWVPRQVAAAARSVGTSHPGLSRQQRPSNGRSGMGKFSRAIGSVTWFPLATPLGLDRVELGRRDRTTVQHQLGLVDLRRGGAVPGNLPDMVGELPLRRLDLNPITPGHPRVLHDQIDEHAENGNTIRKIIQRTFARTRSPTPRIRTPVQPGGNVVGSTTAVVLPVDGEPARPRRAPAPSESSM